MNDLGPRHRADHDARPGIQIEQKIETPIRHDPMRRPRRLERPESVDPPSHRRRRLPELIHDTILNEPSAPRPQRFQAGGGTPSAEPKKGKRRKEPVNRLVSANFYFRGTPRCPLCARQNRRSPSASGSASARALVLHLLRSGNGKRRPRAPSVGRSPRTRIDSIDLGRPDLYYTMIPRPPRLPASPAPVACQVGVDARPRSAAPT